MKHSDSRGLKTAQWFSNMILRDDDINFINASAYKNYTDQLSALLLNNTQVLHGLTLSQTSGMTCTLSEGVAISFEGTYFEGESWEYVESAGSSFIASVPDSANVAFISGGAQDRIDVLEIRPVRADYNSVTRKFKDPVTTLVSSALVDTRVEYSYEFQIIQGAEGASPVAEGKTSGWIKLAEVYISAGVSSISDANISGVADSDIWTTESSNTVIGGIPGIYNSIEQTSAYAIKKVAERIISSGGLILPLYSYPTDIFNNEEWNKVMDILRQYPDVGAIVSINPASGPGTVTDGNYRVGIDRLHGAGAYVAGYVSTDYMNNSLAVVKADIDTWVELYPEIDGIFLDEMTVASVQENYDYYAELTYYIRQSGLTLSVANPGAPFPKAYIDNNCADMIIGWESSVAPTKAQATEDYDEGAVAYPVYRRGIIIHTLADPFLEDAISDYRKYYGWWCLTPEELPNPYEHIPYYLDRYVRYLSTQTFLTDTERLGELPLPIVGASRPYWHSAQTPAYQAFEWLTDDIYVYTNENGIIVCRLPDVGNMEILAVYPVKQYYTSSIGIISTSEFIINLDYDASNAYIYSVFRFTESTGTLEKIWDTPSTAISYNAVEGFRNGQFCINDVTTLTQYTLTGDTVAVIGSTFTTSNLKRMARYNSTTMGYYNGTLHLLSWDGSAWSEIDSEATPSFSSVQDLRAGDGYFLLHRGGTDGSCVITTDGITLDPFVDTKISFDTVNPTQIAYAGRYDNMLYNFYPIPETSDIFVLLSVGYSLVKFDDSILDTTALKYTIPSCINGTFFGNRMKHLIDDFYIDYDQSGYIINVIKHVDDATLEHTAYSYSSTKGITDVFSGTGYIISVYTASPYVRVSKWNSITKVFDEVATYAGTSALNYIAVKDSDAFIFHVSDYTSNSMTELRFDPDTDTIISGNQVPTVSGYLPQYPLEDGITRITLVLNGSDYTHCQVSARHTVSTFEFPDTTTSFYNVIANRVGENIYEIGGLFLEITKDYVREVHDRQTIKAVPLHHNKYLSGNTQGICITEQTFY